MCRFPAFSTRAREHASTRFCLSPVRPNRHAAVVRPAPPPSCSLNPLFVSTGMPRNKTFSIFLFFSSRARRHASTLCCLNPLRPNHHAAVVRPTPPPTCSLNPLLVSAGTPIDVMFGFCLVFSTPARGHASARCCSRPVRPNRQAAAVSFPTPPPMRNCR